MGAVRRAFRRHPLRRAGRSGGDKSGPRAAGPGLPPRATALRPRRDRKGRGEGSATRYADRPDPQRLLGPRFTIRDLHDIHEAVAGTALQKDTFRRAMEADLRGAGTLSSGTVSRPSQRFRRAR